MDELKKDTLFYFSKSAHKKVGKGVNEFVNNFSDYKELDKIKDWRKVLSNFYVSPFTWRGKTWNTVEHAFQSRKIELEDEKKSEWFTLESGHDIGKGDGNVARKNRKLVMLSVKNIKEWNNIKFHVMEEILYCKFSQNEFCKKVLLETKNAELLHSFGRGMKPQRVYELENVREILKNNIVS